MAGQYSEKTLAAMQAVYGPGFLSPGGAEEVGQMIGGLDLAGLTVLDFGSGLGGAAFLLARAGAASVLGVDLEEGPVARARETAGKEGLAERVSFRLVEPGPLPLDPACFDLAFSKDVICHVPEKAPVFADLYRVLKPGGRIVIADFASGSLEGEAAFADWVEGMRATGLGFTFQPAAGYAASLEEAGFRAVEIIDHNGWSAERCRREIAWAQGEGRPVLQAQLGEEGLAARIALTGRRLAALESGGLRHLHVRARKSA